MKKLLSLVLALLMVLSALPVVAEEEYREPITLTVFSQVANFAGEQKGCLPRRSRTASTSP